MVSFPKFEQMGDSDVVAIGGNLSAHSLLEAYSKGIFPWPQEGFPLLWFCPRDRGLLFFSEVTYSRSWRRALREKPWRWTWDQDFERVIDECARQRRRGQNGTWISREIKAAYLDFYEQGFAHSLECWLDGMLVGGIYGVYVCGQFSGESMFHKVDNASKVSLMFLINYLQSWGLSYLDCQMVTPIVENVGGRYVPREYFFALLRESQTKNLEINFKSLNLPTAFDKLSPT